MPPIYSLNLPNMKMPPKILEMPPLYSESTKYAAKDFGDATFQIFFKLIPKSLFKRSLSSTPHLHFFRSYLSSLKKKLSCCHICSSNRKKGNQDHAGLISQPFQTMGMHAPQPQGHGFVSQSPQGPHMSLLLGHNALPFAALPGMQVPMHQGLPSIAQPNVMGGMQSLVTQGATTGEEAMGNWCKGSNQANQQGNQHMQ